MIRIENLRVIFLIALISSIPAHANEVRLEVGGFQTVSNRFNIPNPGGSRVLVKDKNHKFYGRAQATFQVSKNGFLRFMAAPLATEYSYVTQTPLSFNGITIPAQSTTNVTYQFNSYRFGYLYRLLDSKKLSIRTGLIGKIRQAKIEITGNGSSSTYSNVGFVPLLNFGLNWNLYGRWDLRLDVDGAAAKQGRAIDGSAEAFYQLDKKGSGLSMGLRVLEGGANNDKVNTFSLFQYAFLSGTIGL